ncbi:hypothetical protein MTR67_013078 [Solanum verrucosum]|uniref:Endonuclease/exonuclease/phosphatase domain-containing protein n=1 Tax=Solanum verrucosum TaxID=315347 RepID=A0AAF0QAV3_SOLVR|nr:hypothetical protein MTR67_013078 [Solanum verrucosum]
MKTKQSKETIYPDLKLKVQNMNTILIKGQDNSKIKESDMKIKFSSIVSIPTEVVFETKEKIPEEKKTCLDIIEDKEQHVLVHVYHPQNSMDFHIVYAKCDEKLRVPLWDDLRDIYSRITGHWGVVGDFNAITCPEEKIGGLPFRLEESYDFTSYLDDCDLQDGGYLGPKFTWSDNRDPPNTIWKRLDRLTYNIHWFLNIWADHEKYLFVIQEDWTPSQEGNPSQVLHQKIKNTIKGLSSWSRTAFGDLYEEP